MSTWRIKKRRGKRTNAVQAWLNIMLFSASAQAPMPFTAKFPSSLEYCGTLDIRSLEVALVRHRFIPTSLREVECASRTQAMCLMSLAETLDLAIWPYSVFMRLLPRPKRRNLPSMIWSTWHHIRSCDWSVMSGRFSSSLSVLSHSRLLYGSYHMPHGALEIRAKAPPPFEVGD